jgi:arylsulfatase A-like enzyme
MSKRPPNIVITMADDQRHDLIGALGHPMLRTPALDRLVREGTCFTRAHCMGSTHGAVCAPSRAMLHTGRSLFNIPGAIRQDYGPYRPPCDVDPETIPLLGELLQQAGYRTVATGKWHNERHTFTRSFNEGRSVFFRGMANHFATPVCDYVDGAFTAETPGDGHSTDLFTNAAVDYIRRCDENQPFFLLCAFTAPHDPRDAPPHWHERYRPEQIELPPNFMPVHPFDNGELDVRDEKLAASPRDPDEIRRHIADYYAITAHMDDGIGRILAALDERGLADDTIVVHTADHGLSVGQHGLMGKQNLYDHSVRVPLLMRGPGIAAGHRDDRLCYQHDLFPTLLQLASPDTRHDSIFHDLLRPVAYDTLFTTYREVMRAARDARHKLIEYRVAGTRTTQLFDLHDDPWELWNVADERPEVVAVLREALLHWQARVNDSERGFTD